MIPTFRLDLYILTAKDLPNFLDVRKEYSDKNCWSRERWSIESLNWYSLFQIPYLFELEKAQGSIKMRLIMKLELKLCSAMYAIYFLIVPKEMDKQPTNIDSKPLAEWQKVVGVAISRF